MCGHWLAWLRPRRRHAASAAAARVRTARTPPLFRAVAGGAAFEVAIGHEPLEYEPGTQSVYSDPGSTGRCIERADGAQLDVQFTTWLRTNIGDGQRCSSIQPRTRFNESRRPAGSVALAPAARRGPRRDAVRSTAWRVTPDSSVALRASGKLRDGGSVERTKSHGRPRHAAPCRSSRARVGHDVAWTSSCCTCTTP